MGTGGGELLKTFHHPSNKTQVTEAWQPNINILKHTIAKQGIKVHALPAKHEDALPVKNGSLNMITNSHAAFNPKLIKDKLKTGGYFISQQAGALVDCKINPNSVRINFTIYQNRTRFFYESYFL
ncbi:hypothetical protein [Lactiplantibacillus plantarum]|uniref:hypothetical protein n=1 Tax=Lactiplantibacillus plantarum TaxID=1590 RepID=UPI001C9E3212|nr:hypothetical protein [Lactiplantibacillus plantarum]